MGQPRNSLKLSSSKLLGKIALGSSSSSSCRVSGYHEVASLQLDDHSVGKRASLKSGTAIARTSCSYSSGGSASPVGDAPGAQEASGDGNELRELFQDFLRNPEEFWSSEHHFFQPQATFMRYDSDDDDGGSGSEPMGDSDGEEASCVADTRERGTTFDALAADDLPYTTGSVPEVLEGEDRREGPPGKEEVHRVPVRPLSAKIGGYVPSRAPTPYLASASKSPTSEAGPDPISDELSHAASSSEQDNTGCEPCNFGEVLPGSLGQLIGESWDHDAVAAAGSEQPDQAHDSSLSWYGVSSRVDLSVVDADPTVDKEKGCVMGDLEAVGQGDVQEVAGPIGKSASSGGRMGSDLMAVKSVPAVQGIDLSRCGSLSPMVCESGSSISEATAKVHAALVLWRSSTPTGRKMLHRPATPLSNVFTGNGRSMSPDMSHMGYASSSACPGTTSAGVPWGCSETIPSFESDRLDLTEQSTVPSPISGRVSPYPRYTCQDGLSTGFMRRSTSMVPSSSLPLASTSENGGSREGMRSMRSFQRSRTTRPATVSSCMEGVLALPQGESSPTGLMPPSISLTPHPPTNPKSSSISHPHRPASPRQVTAVGAGRSAALLCRSSSGHASAGSGEGSDMKQSSPGLGMAAGKDPFVQTVEESRPLLSRVSPHERFAETTPATVSEALAAGFATRPAKHYEPRSPQAQGMSSADLLEVLLLKVSVDPGPCVQGCPDRPSTRWGGRGSHKTQHLLTPEHSLQQISASNVLRTCPSSSNRFRSASNWGCALEPSKSAGYLFSNSQGSVGFRGRY